MFTMFNLIRFRIEINLIRLRIETTTTKKDKVAVRKFQPIGCHLKMIRKEMRNRNLEITLLSTKNAEY